MTFNAPEFRVQLLLALPDVGLDSPAPANIEDPAEYRETAGYDPAALAEWILAATESARAAGAAEASAAVMASQQELIEMAGAGGVVSTASEVAAYFTQMAVVLKGNLGISQQWDLSRSVLMERDRLAAVAAQLLERFPQLAVAFTPRGEGLASTREEG
jgi:hypothetical protein